VGGAERSVRVASVTAAVALAGALSTSALVDNAQAASPAAVRSARGQEAWVANHAFVSDPGSTLTPVNLDAQQADNPIETARQPATSQPAAMAATGTALVVANRGNDTVSLLDTATNHVVGTAAVGLEPSAVAVAPGGPDGKGIALVTCFGANAVTPVPLATMKAGVPIAVGQEPDAIVVASPAAGSSSATALVANFGSNTVTPITLSSMTPGAPIPVGSEPDAVGIVASSLGPAAIVANLGSNSLTPINLSDLVAGAPIATGSDPTGIAVAPGGTSAWIVDGASLTPFDPGALTLGTPMALPDVAEAVALQGTGRAWVALQDGAVVGVALLRGVVGHLVHVGGRPSAIVIPAA